MRCHAKGYVDEIKKLEKEIKRTNEYLKKLRERKKVCESNLYKIMEKNNEEELFGVKINKVKPKEKKIRKKASDKKKDAINLFYEIGIPDPKSFWEEFQKTQKVILE